MLNSLTLEEAAVLLDACPLAILLLDASGRIRACNHAFAGLTGVVPGAGVAEPEALREEGLLEPLLGSATLVNWILPDGDERWLAVETRILAGTPAGTVRFYIDVTEKLRLRKERDGLRTELKLLSLKDETLTSLMNRRGLLHALEPWSRAAVVTTAPCPSSQWVLRYRRNDRNCWSGSVICCVTRPAGPICSAATTTMTSCSSCRKPRGNPPCGWSRS
jgi:hypothetical protein